MENTKQKYKKLKKITDNHEEHSPMLADSSLSWINGFDECFEIFEELQHYVSDNSENTVLHKELTKRIYEIKRWQK